MTTAAVTIGVLHPGEMGAAVAAEARRRGARVLWYPVGRSQATHERARRAGLQPVHDLGELLGQCEIVFSICPPTAVQQVAAQVMHQGFKGLYVEANATSPQRSIRIADKVIEAGAYFLDAAIFGPPPQADTTACGLYVAGTPAAIETVAILFEGTAVQVVKLEGGIGAASALKMAYSGYQKTTRVLAAIAHALAGRYGVSQHLVAEARHAAGSPLAEPEQLPSAAARAWRWTPELHEIADALEAEDLPSTMALAAANLLFRWHDDKDDWSLSIEEVLEQLHEPT
jgi:3-hydroxyisobutyrate dehydrogenase-like beta-hydroxyacid dehydrogenase